MLDRFIQAARGTRFRGAAFFCTVICIGAGATFPLVTTDIWWHLAAAREMLARGAFLRTDPFSVSAFAYPWLDVHWLFQLAAYAVHAVGGIPALIGFRALLFAGIWAVMLRVVPDRRAFLPGLAAAAVTAFSVRHHMLMRPTLFSLLFAALFLLFLERFRRTGRNGWLWALMPVQAVWANMQGLFIIGPVLVGMAVASELAAAGLSRLPLAYVRFVSSSARHAVPRLAAAFVGVAVACMVNPYGWRLYALPFRLFGVIAPFADNPYSSGIAENIPGGSGTLLLKTAGLVLIALMVVNRRRLSVFRVSVFIAFAGLAAMAGRNMPLYAAVLVPLVMGEAASVPALPSRRLRRWAVAAGMLAAAASCTAGVVRRMTDPVAGRTVPFRYPAGAVAYLERNPVPGTVFNAARHGGYLLWHRFSAYRVLMDGRFTIRPSRFLRDYLALLDAPASFPAYFERYGVTHAVVPLDRRQRYAGLAAELYRHPGWSLAYADGADAVFVRGDVFAGVPENPYGNGVRRRITAVFTDPGLRERAFGNIRGMVN